MAALEQARRALAGGFVGTHRELCAAFGISQNKATEALHELLYCRHATMTEEQFRPSGQPKRVYRGTPRLTEFMASSAEDARFENLPIHVLAAMNRTPLEEQWFDVVRGEEETT